MAGCGIIGGRWAFSGTAQRTVRFMADLYQAGGDARKLIEDIFDNIRSGKYASPRPKSSVN